MENETQFGSTNIKKFINVNLSVNFNCRIDRQQQNFNFSEYV